MATLICRQDTVAAQQEADPLRKPPQNLTCEANRPLGAKPKYTWRPEYDAYLKAQYFGGLNRRFRVLNRMIRQTGLPRWYIKRQASRLGLTMHMDRKPWTHTDLDVLDNLVGRVSAATIAKRLHRPVSSVVNKCKRMRISRRVRDGYTMRDLEVCLGEDHHRISGWIKNGWLQDRLQGTGRHDGNGRDIHRIHEKDILDFIKNHPQEIHLGKVDQTWFLDLVLLKGREPRQGKSPRNAVALADDEAA
jgi:hypothetical protein